MTFVRMEAALVLLCLVGLNAFRYPDEEILERLYDLEMRQQPLFRDDPRYHSLQQQEEEHPMVLDSILPYFPEEGEDDEDESSRGGDYYRENNDIQPRDDADQYLRTAAELRSNDIRDPEAAQQSALWGTHYVSGGAGEGKQVLKPNGEEKNKLEVKSDNALPAYCEPPNPCPKGYTESDNCVRAVKDTPAFNRKYILSQQESGYCTCDSEHMKQCPHKAKMGSKQDSTEADILNALNKQDIQIDAKRRLFNRVAKKSPRMFKRSIRLDEDRNPYMGGPKLRTAAKKSPPAMEWDKWTHYNKMADDERV